MVKLTKIIIMYKSVGINLGVCLLGIPPGDPNEYVSLCKYELYLLVYERSGAHAALAAFPVVSVLSGAPLAGAGGCGVLFTPLRGCRDF